MARAWHWLTEPGLRVPEPWRQQARLLAGVLVVLLGISLLAALVVGLVRLAYPRITPSAIVAPVLISASALLAYRLNRTGAYQGAATLTVAIVSLGVVIAIAGDRNSLERNLLPLAYLTLPIVLAGLLLSAAQTAGLGGLLLGVAIVMHQTAPERGPVSLMIVVLLLASITLLVAVSTRQRQVDAEAIVHRTEALRQANQRLSAGLSEQQRRTREITLLNELAGLLAGATSEPEAYEVAAVVLPQLFPGTRGLLAVLTASRTLAQAVATWGNPPVSAGLAFAPDDCWAFRRGQVHLVDGHHLPLLCRHLDQPPARAYLCVPTMGQGEAIGVLHIEWPAGAPEAPDDGPQASYPLARTTADSLMLAIANLRLRESLRQQSIRDPLTGLFNRRYLEETLEREVSRAARAGRSLSVIMLDIDHFKQFNDNFGHEAGDLVLRELGRFLDGRLRSGDIACRYGGEEFTLILPEATLAAARERAEQIRLGVRHLHVRHLDRLLGRLTLSLGVAAFPEHGPNGERLLRAADAALLRAKREGRDRLVVFA